MLRNESPLVVAGCNLATLLLVFTCCLATEASLCGTAYTCEVDSAGTLHMKCILGNENPTSAAGGGGGGPTVIPTHIDGSELPVNTTTIELQCPGDNNEVRLSFSIFPELTQLIINDVKLSDLEVNSTTSIFDNKTMNLRKLTLKKIRNKNITRQLFTTLYNLKSLVIYNIADIETIDQYIFDDLHNLEVLNLQKIGNNRHAIPVTEWESIVSGVTRNCKSLKTLIFRENLHQPVELNVERLFAHEIVHSLRTIDFQWNNIRKLSGNLISTLPNLKYFNIANNLFNFGNQTKFWRRLLEHAHIKDIDISYATQTDLFRPLSLLYFSSECSSANLLTSLRLGPYIRSVNLHGGILLNEDTNSTRDISNNNNINGNNNNKITHHDTSIMQHLCIRDQNSLRYLDMTSIQMLNSINISLSAASISYVSFQNSKVVFTQPDVFGNMPKLKVLLLGDNDLEDFLRVNADVLFSNNAALEVLDVARCSLRGHMPSALLKPLVNLRVLNISGNSLLESVTDINFGLHKNMSLLNISLTSISELTYKTLAQFDTLHDLTIDISANSRLKCTKDLLKWLHGKADSSPHLFLNIDETTCRFQNGSIAYFAKLVIKRKIIKNSKQWISVVIIIIAILAVSTVAVFLVWIRYKWKIALYIYKKKKKYSNKMHLDSEDLKPVFSYDVYVCYSKADRIWVLETMVPRIEGEGLRTLIHERDYLPGAVIEQAIQESLDASRWTILVITEHFLASPWCMRELHLANVENCKRKIHENLDKLHFDDLIIPIILDANKTCLEDIARVGILHQSFLQWPGEKGKGQGLDDRMALFWDKLITRLKTGGNLKKR